MIGMIAGWLEDAIRATPEGARTIVAIQILLWVSAVVSGLIDNIPYVLTMGKSPYPFTLTTHHLPTTRHCWPLLDDRARPVHEPCVVHHT